MDVILGRMRLFDLLLQFEDYLLECRFSPGTISCYVSDARLFVKYADAQERPSQDVVILNTEIIEDFLESYQDKPKVIRWRKASVLRVWFEYLRAKGVMTSPNPIKGRRKQPLRVSLLKPRDHAEIVVPISNLPDSIPDPETFAIWRLRRDLAFTRGEVERGKEQIQQKNLVIQEQIDVWELILNHSKVPTMTEVVMNLKDLKSTLAYDGPAYTGAFEKLFKSAQGTK